jgi:uncharacterized protein
LTLDAAPAAERIGRGLELFARLGLEPIGFVPPAWLGRPSLADVIRGAGLRVVEDDVSVTVLEPRWRVSSPVVRWSGRTATRALGSAVVADVRWRLQRRAPVMRIAFHPSDLDHPASARSATRSLERWLSDRAATRYGQLLCD